MTSIAIGLVITLACVFASKKYIAYSNINVYFREDSAAFSLLEFIQNKIDDTKLNSMMNSTTSAEAALVAIDEDSISEIGRWPWSRDVMADLTEEVLKNGARSITFDVVFSEAQRENLAADKKFGSIIEKYKDRVILGTASTEQIPTRIEPYKDICLTEAFLYLGGQEMVKIPAGNLPRFVIDDETETFETARWDLLFKDFFSAIKTKTTTQFLKERKVKSTAEMTFFQSNALTKLISENIYGYCNVWLTKSDFYLYPIEKPVLAAYQEALGKDLNKGTIYQELETIKTIKSHPIPQYLGWLQNINEIQKPALYTASFNIKPDSDGLIRHYPLFSRIGNKTGSSFLPSLALQMYLHALQLRAEASFVYSAKNNEKIISAFKTYSLINEKSPANTILVDDFSRIRIKYYGRQKTFPHISAKDLIDKNSATMKISFYRDREFIEETVSKKEFLKDRTILFGATALGLYDLRNTPVANLFPGPEIHLNAFANLIDGNYILDLKNSEDVIPWAVFALGFVFTILISLSSSLIMPIVLIASIVITYVIELLIYKYQNIMMTSWPFYVVLMASFACIATFKFFTEEKSKRQIRKAFSKYVSPIVVNELLKSDSNLALGGKKQRLAVFFSDLRGFTSFSESLDPQELAQFLNIYFNKMTDEVFAAKGTLDKFIGDAVMAFFGAPLQNDNNSELACVCALNSIHRLDELNKELRDKKYPHLEMGIGINTGDVSVGNMGSSVIQNYTVMGDTVNLASRLEGLTKEYGVKIIIGEQTYLDVKNKFLCREIDLVRVKGRSDSTSIYELITDGELQAEEKEWLSTYNRAREFYKSGFFSEALPNYKRCLELHKFDQVSQIFIERCKDFLTHPPDPNWDGVYVLKSK
jgi:adenylate cyclase